MHLERLLGIHWELPLNRLFTSHQAIGLLGSYWYASLHYVVTGATLLWLYKLGTRSYLPARRALVAGTLIGLVAYLLMPTAPPRFITGYVDVLSLHASDGWWSTDASAPRGLGGLTNELAAFPSLHAGWALWVAISVQRNAAWRWVRALAWVYAAGTAVVIVGTGNHWVIDVVVGWLVVLGGFAIARRMPRPLVPAADPVGVVPLAGQPTATSG
nr:phosphatase PAP2 family protein [Nocardioides luti]